jgi:hypothetical protein
MAKLSSKIVSTLIGVAVGVSAVSVAATVHPASTNNAVSSETSSVTSSVASEVTSSAVSSTAEVSSAQATAPSNPTVSSKEVSSVEDGIDAIKKATDEGIEKIHNEADKAVKQVQGNAPKTVTHKLTATGKITISSAGESSADDSAVSKPQAGWIKVLQSFFSEDESEKFVAFGYGGCLGGNSDLKTVDGLKKMGFKLLDANGKSVDFTDYRGWMWIKVPYTNLSDISTLYLTYQDQKITITIN